MILIDKEDNYVGDDKDYDENECDDKLFNSE